MSNGPETPPTRKPRIRPGEVAIYLVLLATAVYAWIGAADFATEGARWPRILATILGSALIVERLSVLVVSPRWQQYISSRRSDTAATARSDGEPSENVRSDDVREASAAIAVGVAAAFFLYILLAYGVGFLLATPIFAVAFMVWKGFHRRPIVLVGVTVGLTATIYVLFGRIISTPLTSGAWLDYDLPGPL